MKKKYLIIPGNDDQNRGDQALVWTTKKIAEESGFIGDYYMFSDPKKSLQSIEHGIVPVDGLLLHPSRKFKEKNNIKYSQKIIFKWGIVAIYDLFKSFLLFVPLLNSVIYSFSSSREKHAIDIIKQSDCVFIKGGGFVHSYGKITSFYTMYYMLYHILLAKKFQKKVIMMPNSFGPFEGFFTRHFILHVLKKIDLVLSRESISQKALQEKLKIKSILAPDLGFYLGNKSCEENLFISNSKKNIALTARPYRFPECQNSEERYNNYIQEYAKFVLWLLEEGYNPVFIEQVYNENDHEKDIYCINQICRIVKLNGLNINIISNTKLNCEELKYIYSRFNYMVGTRFHSVIFAISEGVPSIAITYGGNKGVGIMRDLELEEYSVPILEFNFNLIKDCFNKLITSHIDYCKQMAKLEVDRLELIELLRKNG